MDSFGGGGGGRTVDELTDFKIVERRGYLRPRSFLSIDDAADLVDAALAFARARGLREVVADVTALAGFASPTVIERFWIVSRWARTARGCVSTGGGRVPGAYRPPEIRCHRR